MVLWVQKTQGLKSKIKEDLALVAWHPSRWWKWCVPEDDKKETEKFFLTTWYTEIKNVEDVEIWSKIGYN